MNANGSRNRLVKKYTDLEVYQWGFAAAMRIFHLSKKFPKEEMYSLTDQVRRSSRSVCSGFSTLDRFGKETARPQRTNRSTCRAE